MNRARERELLAVRGLSKHYPVRTGAFGRASGVVRAVEDLSFAIAPGRTLGLVGESGCGKTTAGRCVLRLIEPTAGAIVFEGADISRLTEREMFAYRRKMQLVFQDPYGSLNPRLTVGQILREGMEIHGIASGKEASGKVEELLDLVGLPRGSAPKYPHEFSGGQRQRIGVARALSVGPSFIVCDEPVSALDVSVQAQIVNLLCDLQGRLGIAYLFIAHDLAVVEHISHDVMVMYLGHAVESATKPGLFRRPLHPYTKALLASAPRRRPGEETTRQPAKGEPPSPLDPPPGCPFEPRCPIARPSCRDALPALAEMEPGHFVRCPYCL